MRQMLMTTEMTTLHRISPLAWHCASSTLTSTSTENAHHVRAQSCSLCTFHHTHIWLKFEQCPHSTHDHHHGHPYGCCLFDLTSFFNLFVFLLCLPLPLLPPQRRAAAGAQPEDHEKPVQLRYQREWGHLRRPLPPQKILVQWVELKWFILNKWKRLFQSSRVKFHSVNMSARWYLVSM